MSALPFRTGWGAVRFIPASHGATRLERLERLHGLAKDSEFAALPCTPERRMRARRADRIMEAIRDELRAQVFAEPCGACGRPARIETGLCDRCQESYDAEMASQQAYWMGSA